MVDGSSALLNVAVIALLTATPVVALAGVVAVTVGAVVSGSR